MIEVTGDLWAFRAGATCVTTNGTLRADGSNVMGGGCARQAVDRVPNIDMALGRRIEQNGNHVYVLATRARHPMIDDSGWPLLHGFPGRPLLHGRRDGWKLIVSFPTKDDVRKDSDIDLIIRSAHELVAMTGTWKWKRVVIPRPGCGLGGLKWEDVGPKLRDILDDRFFVISNV